MPPRPALLATAGGGGGGGEVEGITPHTHATSCQTSGEASYPNALGLPHLCPLHQVQLYCAAQMRYRVCSPECCRLVMDRQG